MHDCKWPRGIVALSSVLAGVAAPNLLNGVMLKLKGAKNDLCYSLSPNIGGERAERIF